MKIVKNSRTEWIADGKGHRDYGPAVFYTDPEHGGLYWRRKGNQSRLDGHSYLLHDKYENSPSSLVVFYIAGYKREACNTLTTYYPFIYKLLRALKDVSCKCSY
jgi:hypothetical protein